MSRILVAFERSGVVRDAFIEEGYDAISCDLEDTESPGPHVIGDARPLLRERWDLVIAHPPCTYLANSGVHWLGRQEGRWAKLKDAASLFLECLNANAGMVAVENPTMHKYAVELVGRNKSFAVQPWEFGHSASKRTCFWTRGLPPLMPTQIMRSRSVHWMMKLGPSEDRVRIRSRTFEGIARAMATQWGALL